MVENNVHYHYVTIVIKVLGRYLYKITVRNNVDNGLTRFTVITVITVVT